MLKKGETMLKKKIYVFVASLVFLLPAAAGAMQRRQGGVGPQRIAQLTQQAKSLINNAQTEAALQQVDAIINQLGTRTPVANELKELKSNKMAQLQQQLAQQQAAQQIAQQQAAQQKAAQQQLAQQQALAQQQLTQQLALTQQKEQELADFRAVTDAQLRKQAADVEFLTNDLEKLKQQLEVAQGMKFELPEGTDEQVQELTAQIAKLSEELKAQKGLFQQAKAQGIKEAEKRLGQEILTRQGDYDITVADMQANINDLRRQLKSTKAAPVIGEELTGPEGKEEEEEEIGTVVVEGKKAEPTLEELEIALVGGEAPEEPAVEEALPPRSGQEAQAELDVMNKALAELDVMNKALNTFIENESKLKVENRPKAQKVADDAFAKLKESTNEDVLTKNVLEMKNKDSDVAKEFMDRFTKELAKTISERPLMAKVFGGASNQLKQDILENWDTIFNQLSAREKVQELQKKVAPGQAIAEQRAPQPSGAMGGEEYASALTAAQDDLKKARESVLQITEAVADKLSESEKQAMPQNLSGLVDKAFEVGSSEDPLAATKEKLANLPESVTDKLSNTTLRKVIEQAFEDAKSEIDPIKEKYKPLEDID